MIIFKCVIMIKTLNSADFSYSIEGFGNVRMKGLEPPCLAALDPKSSASTNFATSACVKKWNAKST